MEADRVGTLIAAKAGYDPRAAVLFWEKVRARHGEPSSALLSTHPLPSERIAGLREEAVRVFPIYAERQPLRLGNTMPRFEFAVDAGANGVESASRDKANVVD